jgi:hypothetical protein
MAKYKDPPVTKGNDKFAGFLSVTPNKKFMKLFDRAGVCNVLISYHYIRKNPSLTKDFMDLVESKGGLFMTDSGAFSFLNDPSFDANNFDWFSYTNEYVEWLDQNKRQVYTACNLDVDNFVGHDIVRTWNDTFFKPLESDMNIAYVAHPNVMGRGVLDAFNEYTDEHKMVAVSEEMVSSVSSIYQRAKIKKVDIHGLAWTKPTLLTDFPFFSVDSSSWVNYQKYGATPVWDGKNFAQYDKDKKHIRKSLPNQCRHYGVKFYEFCNEVDEGTTKHNDDEGLTFSLRTWLDVFHWLKNYARVKLNTKVKDLDKSGIIMEEKEEAPKKKSLADRIANSELDVSESSKVRVVDENSDVALYDKREKESINAYKERAGDTMVCNHCYVADKCPKMQEDATCAFDFAPEETTKNPLAVIDALIATQTERVNRAMFIEKMEGGMPNKTFATEVKLLQQLNNDKTNMLMMMQTKGVIVTQTTHLINKGTSDDEAGSSSGGGFKDMLMDAMKSKK